VIQVRSSFEISLAKAQKGCVGLPAVILFIIWMTDGWQPQMLSLVVALSTLGNTLALLFAQGRLVQELGREGVLPWSSFFASDLPFNNPMVGLSVHWAVCSAYILATPPGDAYLFVLSCT
jgi:amino acid transporter